MDDKRITVIWPRALRAGRTPPFASPVSSTLVPDRVRITVNSYSWNDTAELT